MALLHQDDRNYILTQLQLAPDEILADAMLALNAHRDKIVAVRRLVMTTTGSETGVSASEKVDNSDNQAKHPATRPNISPGPSMITKIGSATLDTIMRELGSGVQPSAKFVEHCKLLWARGSLKFDGKEYYL